MGLFATYLIRWLDALIGCFFAWTILALFDGLIQRGGLLNRYTMEVRECII